MTKPRMRVRKSTQVLANGTKVIRQTLVEAPQLEWRLQAAAVRALKAMPEFGRAFDLEGDFNAARRSMQESVKAKATGLTPGAFDLRIYMTGGRLGLIEMKAARGRLSPEQVDRHAALRRLGFEHQAVVKVTSEDEAATACVSLVRGWLAANDNTAADPAVAV